MLKVKTPDIPTVICKVYADYILCMSGNPDGNITASHNLVFENSIGPKEIRTNTSLLVKTVILKGRYCAGQVIRLPDCIIEDAVKQACSEEEPKSEHNLEPKIKALFAGFHVRKMFLHTRLKKFKQKIKKERNDVLCHSEQYQFLPKISAKSPYVLQKTRIISQPC